MKYKKIALGILLIMLSVWVGTGVSLLLESTEYQSIQDDPWGFAKAITSFLSGCIVGISGLILIVIGIDE